MENKRRFITIVGEEGLQAVYKDEKFQNVHHVWEGIRKSEGAKSHPVDLVNEEPGVETGQETVGQVLETAHQPFYGDPSLYTGTLGHLLSTDCTKAYETALKAGLPVQVVAERNVLARHKRKRLQKYIDHLNELRYIGLGLAYKQPDEYSQYEYDSEFDPKERYRDQLTGNILYKKLMEVGALTAKARHEAMNLSEGWTGEWISDVNLKTPNRILQRLEELMKIPDDTMVDKEEKAEEKERKKDWKDYVFETYGVRPQVILAYALTDPSFKLKISEEREGLTLQQIVHLVQDGKLAEVVPEFGENAHTAKLLEYLALSHTDYYFDFTRSGKRDRLIEDNNLSQTMVKPKTIIDLLGLFHHKDDNEAKEVINKFIKSVKVDHINPYDIMKSSTRIMANRKRLVELILDGRIRWALDEIKTSFRDQYRANGQWHNRSFDMSYLPEWHEQEVGISGFALHNAARLWVTSDPTDKRYQFLREFEGMSRDDDRFDEILARVKDFAWKLLAKHNKVMCTRIGAPIIHAATEDNPDTRKLFTDPFGGLMPDAVEHAQIGHHVHVLPPHRAWQVIRDAGNELMHRYIKREQKKKQATSRYPEEI